MKKNIGDCLSSVLGKNRAWVKNKQVPYRFFFFTKTLVKGIKLCELHDNLSQILNIANVPVNYRFRDI